MYDYHFFLVFVILQCHIHAFKMLLTSEINSSVLFDVNVNRTPQVLVQVDFVLSVFPPLEFIHMYMRINIYKNVDTYTFMCLSV